MQTNFDEITPPMVKQNYEIKSQLLAIVNSGNYDMTS